MNELTAQKSKLDIAGIFLSVTCAIHCAAIPVLTSSAPIIASYFQSSWVHVGLILFVLPIAGYSFYKTYQKSGNRLPLVLGLIGITTLFAGMFMHEHFFNHNHAHLHSEEIFVNIIGSTFLVLAHIINIKKGHLHSCKED